MADRFDYIGFANGGKDVKNGPGLIRMIDGATGGAMSKIANATIGNVGRAIQQPLRAVADIQGGTVNTLANGANRLLKAITGYEVPYEAALPTDWTSNNLRRISDSVGDIASAGIDMGLLRRAPQANAAQAPTPQRFTPPKEYDGPLFNPSAGIKPSDRSTFANGAIPVPRTSESFNDSMGVGSGPGASAPPGQEVGHGGAALTPVGSFQVEGGRKRFFSSDESGAWYDGGKKMSGVMSAGRRGGNPVVDDIMNRLLTGQPGYNGGAALHGDEIAGSAYRSQVEHAMRVNAANGFAPTAEQMRTTGMSNSDLVHLLASNNRRGRYDKMIGSIFQNEAISTAREKLNLDRGKLDLERAMTPVEMKQRLAMANMYQNHGDYYKAMADPDLQLKLKGKDADTEAAKSRSDLIKTLAPKAYDTAMELTKKHLEQYPDADVSETFNGYYSTAMSAFFDKFSQGQRFSPGIQKPGDSSWFGYNTPEINIPGGWGSQDEVELKSDLAAALAATKDPVKRRQLLDMYKELSRGGRARSQSQGIPTR